MSIITAAGTGHRRGVTLFEVHHHLWGLPPLPLLSGAQPFIPFFSSRPPHISCLSFHHLGLIPLVESTRNFPAPLLSLANRWFSVDCGPSLHILTYVLILSHFLGDLQMYCGMLGWAWQRLKLCLIMNKAGGRGRVQGPLCLKSQQSSNSVMFVRACLFVCVRVHGRGLQW